MSSASSASNGANRKRPGSWSSTAEDVTLGSSSTRASSTRLFQKLKDARASSVNAKSGMAQKQLAATKPKTSSGIAASGPERSPKKPRKTTGANKENESASPNSAKVIATALMRADDESLPQPRRDADTGINSASHVSHGSVAPSAPAASCDPSTSALCETHRVDTLAIMFNFMERFEQKLDDVVDSNRALRTDLSRTINRLNTLSDSVDLIVEDVEYRHLVRAQQDGNEKARQQVREMQAITVTTNDRLDALAATVSSIANNVKLTRNLSRDLLAAETTTRTRVEGVSREIAVVAHTIDQVHAEIDLRVEESSESVKAHLLRAERHMIHVPNVCNGIAQDVRSLQGSLAEQDNSVNDVLRMMAEQTSQVDDIHYHTCYNL